MSSAPLRRRSSRRRVLAALGAAALVAPLLPITAAGAAPALPPTQDPREFACPPGQVQDAGFTDTSGNIFELEINCLAGYEITTGVGENRYAPADLVSRAQMAQFIARVATDVAGLRLDTRSAGFTDIGDLSVGARNAINGLANAGIVKGATATTFNPRGDVKREQMATFIAALQDEVGTAFDTGEDYFTDDEDSFHEANINRIAGAGIVTGTGEGSYDPRGNVTRQQMAAFLMRYIEDQVEAGEFEGIYERDNEVLAVSPTDSVTLPVGGEDSGNDRTADNRDYTVSGLQDGVEYRITLLEAGTVSVRDGVTRFTDTDADNLAEVGTYRSDIIRVNGRPVTRTDGGPGAASTTTATPTNGTITFTIDGQGEESVRPVVYTNGGRSPRLELAADDRPIEAFGLGGVTTYTIPAATAEDSNQRGTVTVADKADDEVLVDTEGKGPLRYSYDNSDSFRVQGTTVTFSQFEAELSRGDVIEIGNYSPVTLQTSEFNISTNGPTAPSSVSAEKGTEPQTTDDITVSVSGGSPNPYDGYLIQRAPVNAPPPANGDERPTPPNTTGTYVTVSGDNPVPAGSDADPATAGFQFVFVDQNVPAGSYSYRAIGVVDGDQSPPRTDPNNETSVAPAVPDTVRPFSIDAIVSVDMGSPGSLSFGDELNVVFNERLAEPDSGDRIIVMDADGTTAELVNEGNSLFTLNSGTETVNGEPRGRERVLTIQIGPNFGTTGGRVSGGTVSGLQLPATITEQGGITDQAGLTYDLSRSTDLLFDSDAADEDAGGPDS